MIALKTDEDRLSESALPQVKLFERHPKQARICISVSHPDYVSERTGANRRDTRRPPAHRPGVIGSTTWAIGFVTSRRSSRRSRWCFRKGAILKLSVRADSPGPRATPLYAQVSGGTDQEADFWARLDPGTLLTQRLGSGSPAVRAIRFDPQGWVWFSDVTHVLALTGRTNEVVVNFPGGKQGVALHGQLDAATPRPITHGRVIAQVWPADCEAGGFSAHLARMDDGCGGRHLRSRFPAGGRPGNRRLVRRLRQHQRYEENSGLTIRKSTSWEPK